MATLSPVWGGELPSDQEEWEAPFPRSLEQTKMPWTSDALFSLTFKDQPAGQAPENTKF